MFYSLLFRTEILFAYTAEFTGKIIGKIFPFHTGLFFVIDPAADIAYVFLVFLL